MTERPAGTLGGQLIRGIYHPATLLAVRIFLGVILMYAGWLKLFDMTGMAQSIENFRIVPIPLVNLFAMVLPPVEVITGLCLILGIAMEGALAITTALFAVFTVAIQSAIWRGLDIECGCFGTSDAEVVGAQVLVRDILLLFLTLLLWMGRRRGSASPAGSETEAEGLPAPSGPEI
ncbi:MAG: MauE/DoxX family redox-associated membrane protein [bacterium]